MKTKNRIWLCSLIVMGFVLIFANSCKKEDEILYGYVTDIDHNSYKTVKIGTQVWMAENLKTTKLNDVTAIPLVTDNIEWTNAITPAYCWYENDSATYKATYGALYNWYTGATGKLCPTGWHVPSDEEWHTLTAYLGGDTVASGKLKETGTTHWATPNAGATNETGFTALPGGIRGGLGLFYAISYLGGWWSATNWHQTGAAIPRYIEYSDIWVDADIQYESGGLSVRCLKDN